MLPIEQLHIEPRHLEMLREVFRAYCPHAEIWAYGSRLTDNYHSGSDIDMTVRSFGEMGKSIAELRRRLNDSNVPILMDISEYERLPEYFREEIDRAYVRIFPE